MQIRVQQLTENNVNWCGVGAPNEGWATQVFGEPDVERLWEKVGFCMRLDEPDPGRPGRSTSSGSPSGRPNSTTSTPMHCATGGPARI